MSSSALYVLSALDAPSFERVDAVAATFPAPDEALLRGDGVFETIGVVGQAPQALDAHLARLAESAALLDIPAPQLEVWRAATIGAAATVPVVVQGSVKLVLLRPIPGSAVPVGWIFVNEVPERFVSDRVSGVRAVMLERGLPSDAAKYPWLLAGAKTISYAINMAALREAARRGASEVIFVSNDGLVLEGPTSSVLARFDDEIVTTPHTAGILAGTSQVAAFEYFAQAGFETSYRNMTPEQLLGADAIWLLSSVRLAAPVISLDGQEVPHDVDASRALNDYLLNRRA